MPHPRFSITVDPSLELVRVSMAGYFGPADIARFQAELQLAHRRLACRHRDGPLTLNDIRQMAIQSQDAVERWQVLLTNPALHSRRLAFVVSSALARLQLQRVLGRRPAQIFTAMNDAEAWLLSGHEVNAPEVTR